jgi:DNA-binding MarR family transcriptional regulator
VAVVLRLARVRALLEQEIEALLGQHGLSSPTFAALAAIARLQGEEGVPQVRLMRELKLTSGTVSVRVDRLVADGLAERRPDPGDRRGARVRLTDRGREVFEAAAPAHLDNERRLLAALGPEEQEALAALLRRLLLDLEGPPPDGDDLAGGLGLTVAPAHETRAMRRAVGLPERAGLLVRAVAAGGPAARAGVSAGDLLTGAGGRPVRGLADLHEAIAAAGDELVLELVRRERAARAAVRPAG